MITMTLKDMPRAMHMALKHRARQNGRSLNKEALVCLETVVAPTRVDVHALLAGIRQHRATLPGRLSDRLIHEAQNAGRP